MELPKNAVDKSTKRTGLGRCRHFFWLGVAFDTVGATLLFTGVFADLLFYDLLLYLGSIIIFLSLLWWVFWYTGNIELTSEEALNRSYLLPSATVLEALNQTISNRLSLTIGSISSTFLRIRRRRRRWHRRRFLEGTASLNMTVTGQVENQPAGGPGQRRDEKCQGERRR
nr:transmembrane protein 238-like [Vicugna pacos]